MRTFGREPEALAVISEGIAYEITYFDSSRVMLVAKATTGPSGPSTTKSAAGSFRPASLQAGIVKALWRTST